MANTHSYGQKPKDFAVNATVWTHPGTDAFMQGDTRGQVFKIGKRVVSVRMTRSGKVRSFYPDCLAFDDDNVTA